MANVKFYTGTKKQYLGLASRNPLALYFCDDTGELFKGDICLTDGVRIVPTRADLPECSCAADGIVYFIAETKSGFMVSPDRTEWLQTVYAPVTDAYAIPEEEMYTTVTTVGAVRDIEAKIYERIEEVASSGGITNLTPVDGSLVIKDNTIDVGISAELGNALIKKTDGLYVGTSTSGNYTAGLGLTLADGTFSVKLADNTHGLVAVDGALTLNLATKNSDGAMSKEDKLIVDSIPYAYVARKYDISNTPTGTLVDYRDHEIRVMCPANIQWVKQSVDKTGDANMYYMGLKAYAPNGAASFKEGNRGVIIDEMFTFDSDFAGTDEFGRNYSICWLALASYDESSDTWTYFGKDSTINKYVGWDYVIEWYDANGLVIASDSIRINLSNENCHNNIQPYYMTKYATSEKVEALETIVTEMSESYCWREI